MKTKSEKPGQQTYYDIDDEDFREFREFQAWKRTKRGQRKPNSIGGTVLFIMVAVAVGLFGFGWYSQKLLDHEEEFFPHSTRNAWEIITHSNGHKRQPENYGDRTRQGSGQR